MKFTVKVSGLAELDSALKELPVKMRGRPLRAALMAAARLIEKEAKSRVPVKTGLVKRRIKARSNKSKDSSRAEAHVGVFRGKDATRRMRANKRTAGKSVVEWPKDPFYWRFIEFGTRKMRARPFLRPALDAKRNEAVTVIKDRLAKRIEIEAAKLRKR